MCGIRWVYGDDDRKILAESFCKIQDRWPDFSIMKKILKHTMWFHRLAIMDLSDSGNQPFALQIGQRYIYRSCNWEIYNYKSLIEKYSLTLSSNSDCEIIWNIYMQIWFEAMVKELDWEFVIALIDTDWDKLFLARDAYGVRPLFIWNGNTDNTKSNIYRSSEIKWIVDLCNNIKPFLPWYIMTVDSNLSDNTQSDNKIIYKKYYEPIYWHENDEKVILSKIKEDLFDAVRKRLVSDRPLGCLLSGWLDSSLVCGVAAKLSKEPIYTFTIWLEWWSDIAYAESVAKYIWSKHTTFVATIEEALAAIDEVIYRIESLDTTSIRASVWQYLIGKKIKENTDIKVLLTGEWSDEMSGGYIYFHNAPNAEEFDAECKKLLSDIYMFDGLRVDRSMACHGLEVRIPLLDTKLVQDYLSIDATMRIPKTHGIEKYLLRKAFEEDKIIPSEVLWRKKEAFSDWVSQHTKSRFEIIQERIDMIISDEEFAAFLEQGDSLTWISEDVKLFNDVNIKPFNYPDTKEKYYYYKKFTEYFGEKNLWVINYYRMPKWSGNTKDPSARVLDVYKK